ncbi:hypothetical protein B0H13DRAFT_1892534 [Mycena leptocephala]|nr:hypothetical protein B0H13DRAFT_1892534 [Mycena leptocephala]
MIHINHLGPAPPLLKCQHTKAITFSPESPLRPSLASAFNNDERSRVKADTIDLLPGSRRTTIKMHQGLLTLHFVLIGLFVLGGALEINKYSEPSVREEWRSLSWEQRKHWIASVKCLANSPNDHALVPSINPPDIAPYNTSGSLFDDIVYAHMGKIRFRDALKLIVTPLLDLNHRSVIHLHSARYIGLGYSTLGIAGIFTYLRRHCAIAVGIGELFRTGIGRKKFNLFPQFEQVFPVPGLVYDYTHSANASFIKLVVESLIDSFVGDFKGFQTRMEGVEMVNCIWFKWQKKHKLNTYAFEGGSVQQFENTTVFSQYLNGGPPYLTMNSEIPTDGLSPTFAVADVIGTTEGPLCYVYD